MRDKVVLWYIVICLLAIGIYDVGVGCYMIFSQTPWLANGADTIWSRSISSVNSYPLYQRIGVLSVHAGIVTIILTCYSIYRPKLRSLLILIYLFTGIFFYLYDNYWFSDSTYLVLKTVIGTFFFIAAILQFIGTRKGWWKNLLD